MKPDLDNFLNEPTQERAEAALLWLMGQTPAEADLDEATGRRLLQVLARFGSLNGEGLELLGEPWRPLLWEVCTEHRAELRPFLESQLSGRHQEWAREILEPPARHEQRGWLRKLQYAIHQWSERREQDIDLEPTRRELSLALERASSNPEFTLELRKKTLLELPLDLTRGEERDLLALLWSPEAQPNILRRVAQAIENDGSAQEREEVLRWTLDHGDAQVLRQLVELLSLGGREELVRRFRDLDRREDAAQVLIVWLELGLPTEVRRLSQSMQTFKKYWDLRRDTPELPQLLSTALAPVLWQLRGQSQDLENLLQVFESFKDFKSPLATALARYFVSSELASLEITEADSRALPFRFFLAPLSEKAALLQVSKWHDDFSQIPIRLWSEALRERVLVFPEELQDLLELAPERAQLFAEIYQQNLTWRLAGHTNWQQAQTQRVREQAELYWTRLGGLVGGLTEAWQGAPALLSRLSQLSETVASAPSPQDLCPSLQEETPHSPSLPQSQSRSGPPNLDYVLEHWSGWTSLPQPATDAVAPWMAQQSKDDLCELAFGQVTQILESTCPESALVSLQAFLDLVVRHRPDVDQELRQQAGDALALLPFPWGGTTGVADNSIDYVNWLGELALCLQKLAKLRQRQEQELHGCQQELKRLAARRLGPATDNLEQFLLPYFVFRQGLEDQAGLFTAVTGLNQPIRPEVLGIQVQVAGNGDDDQALRSNTLGIQLVDEERAVWPAYASPRPKQ